MTFLIGPGLMLLAFLWVLHTGRTCPRCGARCHGARMTPKRGSGLSRAECMYCQGALDHLTRKDVKHD